MFKINSIAVLGLLCITSYYLPSAAADPPTKKIFDVFVNLAAAVSSSNCQERKTFFINTRFESSFLQAHLICKDYGYELATLENLREQTALLKFLQSRYQKVDSLKARFWIGATNSKTLESSVNSPKTWPFYWYNTGKNISFALKFHTGFPDDPANENCLEIYKKPTGEYAFNDLTCSSARGFICQLNEC